MTLKVYEQGAARLDWSEGHISDRCFLLGQDGYREPSIVNKKLILYQ